MSIIVLGWVDLEAGGRELWLTHAGPLMVATAQEPGCVDYLIAADPLFDDRIRIVEEWKDMEAFEAHFVAPHVKDFVSAVEGALRLDSSARFYEATERQSPISEG